MKISVIVPIYKPKDYVFKCLESIAANNLKNTEVLLVYNGEKNNLFAEIKVFCNKHSNFCLLYTDVTGLSNARNVGIEASKGEYIFFIDDDDWISDNYFDALLKNAKEDGIVATNVISYDEKSKEYSPSFIGKSFLFVKGKPYNVFRYRKFFSSAWAKLIPRKILGDIRFDTEIKVSEDISFMLELSKNVAEVILPKEDVIYYYRQRESSLISTKRTFKEELGIRFLVLKKCTLIYLKNPFKYNFLFFLSRVFATFYHHIFRFLITR